MSTTDHSAGRQPFQDVANAARPMEQQQQQMKDAAVRLASFSHKPFQGREFEPSANPFNAPFRPPGLSLRPEMSPGYFPMMKPVAPTSLPMPPPLGYSSFQHPCKTVTSQFAGAAGSSMFESSASNRSVPSWEVAEWKDFGWVNKPEENEEDTATLFSRVEARIELTLLPHQVESVLWMMRRERDGAPRGGILADDMGLGKTIQMVALLTRADQPSNARRSP